MGEFLSLLLQRLLRPDEFLLCALTGEENGLGILQSDRAEQIVLIFVCH